MAEVEPAPLMSVAGIWRYPVKSMLGEELAASEVSQRGLVGDRAYALVDVDTGKIVSAKNPRKWPTLFGFRAVLAEAPPATGAVPPARITFPDGASVATDAPDLEARLSTELGRPVRLSRSASDASRIEGYWPDYEWLESRDKVFEVSLPPGTFFDGALVHVVTTATLGRLRSLSPESRFDVARFRPNIVIEATEAAVGFVENGWVGRTLRIGDDVRFGITAPCARCVMTTLPQGNLPKDPHVLRTIVQHNQGNVGVLATVIRGGTVTRGDAAILE